MNVIKDFLQSYPQIIYIMRILIACACGGIIGVERTRRQKDAGFRTHIIVSMGSSLMMIISKYGFFDVVVNDSVSVDASRIAANIITGISFLGAGMIFIKGITIKGLTTAAGIWATSAVGMAIGAGMYAVGVASVILLLLVQIIFHKFLIGFDKVLANDSVVPCFIQIDNTPDSIDRMKNYLKENGIHISDSVVEFSQDNKLITVRLNVQYEKGVDINSVLNGYLADSAVHQAFAI